MRYAKTIVASFTGLVLLAGMGGCAAQRQEVIPATARLQMSGSGDKVYTAPTEGTIYVYDQPGDRLIWSGQVRAGQVVGVAPARSEITLNGAPVSSKVPVGNGRVDMFFEPAPNAQPAAMTMERGRTTSGTSSEGTTVTSPGSFTVQPPPVTVTPSVRVEQQAVPSTSTPAGVTTTPPATPAPAADPGR